jgi:hypothetical protein
MLCARVKMAEGDSAVGMNLMGLNWFHYLSSYTAWQLDQKE